jgi:predicted peptidase
MMVVLKSGKLKIKLIKKTGYLLYLPKGYKKSRQKWPLLIFLHGAFERGTDLDSLKKHGPPRLISEGKEFPFIVVSPQCAVNSSWNAHEIDLLISRVIRKYKVDENRIYMTGLSMGGFGTFSYATAYPERLAAIAPVCGGGDSVSARRIHHIPAWIFHGDKDLVVPAIRSKEMADALQKAGGEVRLTIYPESGHDSWTETYNNPELYEWMLKQKREK